MEPNLPNFVDRRQPISGDAHNRMIDQARGAALHGGPGVLVGRYGAGSVVRTRPAGIVRSRAAGRTPFQVYSVAADKVSVVFGQVNSVTPTIGGTALDDATAPQLTITTSGVIYLLVNLNTDGTVDTAEIHNASTLPAQTAIAAYLTLATVTFGSGAISALNQSVMYSLGHERCGVSFQHFWGL